MLILRYGVYWVVQPNMALTDYLKSGWIAGLKADTVQSQSFNGIEMASGLAQTDQWFFRVAVMRLDGEVYRFIFAAKSDSQRFASGAQQTLQSFRRTDANDLAKIRQLSIRLVTAKAGDTAQARREVEASLKNMGDLTHKELTEARNVLATL